MTDDTSDRIEAALTPTADRHPWERLKDGGKFIESQKAFEAFTIYRDMGPTRSLVKVGQTLAKTRQNLNRWSSQFQWVERCDRYDEHMDRIALLEQEDARRAMAREHIELANAMLEKVAQRLADLDPEQISPAQIPNYIQTAVNIERLAIGESTVNTREITTRPIRYIEVHRQSRGRSDEDPGDVESEA